MEKVAVTVDDPGTSSIAVMNPVNPERPNYQL